MRRVLGTTLFGIIFATGFTGCGTSDSLTPGETHVVETAVPDSLTPDNISLTAQWAATVVNPLNELELNEKNALRRADRIAEASAPINDHLRSLIGTRISWEVPCEVGETRVDIPGLWKADGSKGDRETPHETVLMMRDRESVERLAEFTAGYEKADLLNSPFMWLFVFTALSEITPTFQREIDLARNVALRG